jgi:hypothetical protein
MQMDSWPFVIAAYAVTFAGTLALSIWAWRAARSAEAQADASRNRTRPS